MATLTRHLISAVALTGALFQSAGAQVGVPAADLQNGVTTLANAVAALPPDLRTSRITEAVRWLHNNASKTRPENVSSEYVRSLERAAAVLARPPSAAAVEDVTRELEAKVQHCRTLGVGMGGSVLLRVNTRRGPSVVGDWQVLYLLKFDEWLKTPHRNFLRVSSPTEMSLEPGRYWIWARDPVTGRTSDRVLVEVAGQKGFLLDLPVP